MIFSAIGKTTEKFIVDNCPAILSGVGVIGTIATAVLAAKGGIVSGRKIEDIETERYHDKDASLGPLTTKEKLSWTWKNYIPAAGVGTLTVTSIVMAQRMNMKRAAGLAAAYMISEKKFGEYKDKVTETLGIKKEEAVRADIAQNTVNNNTSTQVIIAGGNVLFYDTMSGRYFRSTMEKIKQAQNNLNAEILRAGCANLSEFYELIDLESTPLSNEVGWTSGNQVQIAFTSTIHEGEPCIVMDFSVSPTRGWSDRFGG